MSDLIERLMQRISLDRGGCWEWIGHKDRCGYGRFGYPKRSAHRLMYEVKVGPIPKGACVLHRCDNPACVNPQHLFLGSQRDNLIDMYRKGRANLSGLRVGQSADVLKKIAAKAHRGRGRFAAKAGGRG